HGDTPLHESVLQDWSQSSKVNELLTAAPNPQEAWNLINTPNKYGDTVLSLAEEIETTEGPLIIQLLESYRPKK
ncbi:MAG TPA: hypothetical protein VJ201_03180, partial [Candidatus Babeliales bacterium]|nr:hypothetical protein [Candidatus Babeliales bacterium]